MSTGKQKDGKASNGLRLFYGMWGIASWLLLLAVIIGWAQAWHEVACVVLLLSMGAALANEHSTAFNRNTAVPEEKRGKDNRTRLNPREQTNEDAFALYCEGSRFEAKGKTKAALARYEEAIAASPGSAAAHDAEASIRSLRAMIE